MKKLILFLLMFQLNNCFATENKTELGITGSGGIGSLYFNSTHIYSKTPVPVWSCGMFYHLFLVQQ